MRCLSLLLSLGALVLSLLSSSSNTIAVFIAVARVLGVRYYTSSLSTPTIIGLILREGFWCIELGLFGGVCLDFLLKG